MRAKACTFIHDYSKLLPKRDQNPRNRVPLKVVAFLVAVANPDILAL